MFNRDYKMGKNVRAARRLAGILMAGTLAGTLAVGNAPAVFVSAATWQENANYIFDYLTQRLHYSEAAACGIMANIRCESTFNPHAWNAGGGSYGLCQWTGGRYGRLQSWCRSNGYDYSTIDGQLAYLEYELQNHYTGVENYLRSVENTRDGAYNAGQYYCYHFEAPASRGSVSVYRGGLASGTFWDSYRPAEWYQVEGIWRYVLRDGSYQTGWLTLEDDTFYFDEEGRRICGWKTIDGKRYYFDDEGVMTTGWMKVDGRNYYFGEDGAMVTGIMRDGEELYLVDEYGTVQGSSDMKKYAPVWIAMKEEEQEQEALASAEDLSEEASETDSSASAASGEKTLAVNTAGENEPEKTKESGQPEEIKDQPAESDYVKEALASVDFGKDALESAAAENIAAEDAFAAPEEGREIQDREAGEDQVVEEPETREAGGQQVGEDQVVEESETREAGGQQVGEDQAIEESEDRNAGRDQSAEETEEPESVLASAGQESDTLAYGQEQHKGLGIQIPGFSTPVQEQGALQDIEGIEEKEDYSSPAEAMLAAAEGLNEEVGEEPEASAFVPDNSVMEEEVSEAAEAAGETVTSLAELTDQGMEEEVSEAAVAAGETESAPAELTDQGGTTGTSLTENGIKAPLADPVRSEESEKTDSAQKTALPFGFSGLIARLTGGADSKKNNPFAPVYSLPFSYTDARILGKQTGDGEYDAEEEPVASASETDIREMPFDAGTSEITLAAGTDDNDYAGRIDDSLKDNPSENSKTGLSDDDEEDKSHQSENMDDFRAGDEDTDGEDKNSTGGNINEKSSGKSGTEEKTVEDDSEDQEKPEDKDDSKEGNDLEETESGTDIDEAEDQDEDEDKSEDKSEEAKSEEDKDGETGEEKSDDLETDEDRDEEDKEDKDDEDDEDSDDSDSEEGEIRLTLNGDIPDISYEDKDDLVDILRRKNILHAVSGNGLNITPQVEASFEREDGDNYTVTFRVEYNGSEAELESSVRITD